MKITTDYQLEYVWTIKTTIGFRKIHILKIPIKERGTNNLITKVYGGNVCVNGFWDNYNSFSDATLWDIINEIKSERK